MCTCVIAGGEENRCHTPYNLIIDVYSAMYMADSSLSTQEDRSDELPPPDPTQWVTSVNYVGISDTAEECLFLTVNLFFF